MTTNVKAIRTTNAKSDFDKDYIAFKTDLAKSIISLYDMKERVSNERIASEKEIITQILKRAILKNL